MDTSDKSLEKYMKKIEESQQAYHLEWPYAHFIVDPKGIVQYKQELMKILNMSAEDMKSLTSESFFHILGEIDDYPIIPRPYSHIKHHIIKSEDPKNPYNVITQIPEFMKKLSGLLQYGVDIQPIAKDTTYIHSHTRYVHSLDTACNIEIIMRNNWFTEEEIKKAIIACCLHDVATPAFGDLTMKAFPTLKEENWFSDYMAHYPERVAEIEKTFDVSLSEIHTWIKNQGTIGKILDIADRLAYTARDVSSVHTSMVLGYQKDDAPEKTIGDITKKDPYLFDIMMEISVKDNQIVFENTERLKNILLLRAHMHNLIYLNPYLWTREEYFGLILQYLVEEWFLSLEQLQKWLYKSDTGINESMLLEYMHKNNIIDHDPVARHDFFDVAVCTSKEEAIAKIQELKKTTDPHMPVHYLKTPAFKPGTHYLVRDKWVVKPLAEVMDAEELAQLNLLSQATNKHLVLYPKKEFSNNHKTHPKLYEFLCKKAQEAYQDLLKK
ncbi:MAG: hypothetical protein ACD_80C00019G0001 [uncultured bacterium (gcode 4)]|uniref:HD/PDEase domain-containing protein n=1 Tax=uncultured bacterium (gcode 4) TaxID=1234023 RepID=K1YJP5_9BACT|nr:MAG: hypothetical protein ACD_80C00019G0001 [uncultured bacterium (gcode 4)]